MAAVRRDDAEGRRRVALCAVRKHAQPRGGHRAGFVEDAVRIRVPVPDEDIRHIVGVAVHEVGRDRGEHDKPAGPADEGPAALAIGRGSGRGDTDGDVLRDGVPGRGQRYREGDGREQVMACHVYP
jgi:hypothetical protein